MSNCRTCNIDTTPLPKSGTDCGITNQNPIYDTGNCAVDENGNPIVTPTPTNNTGCVVGPTGLLCPPVSSCSPFDLTLETPENCLIGNIIGESLSIAGAPIKIYKLLGVHEQGKLLDQVGAGAAFSNGSMPGFPAKNAFDGYITEWRSLQTGPDVLKSAFVGYDFGPIRLENGRARYGLVTAIKHDVTSFRIRQGCDPHNRVTRVRLERSNDGHKWYGVKILVLPDCDGTVKINVPRSVPSRYWRLRPTAFNGGPDDYWAVQALQLIDYEETALDNIQDRIFLENRDRAYLTTPVQMKASYQPIDVRTNVGKWGIFQVEDQYILEVSFMQTVQALGRPFVVGDLIDLIPETQYTPTLTPIRKLVEVNDVAWSVNGYTPGYIPTMLRLIVVPAMASQENADITGKLQTNIDNTGLVDALDPNIQDYRDISQTIKADANTNVPERGEDDADITKLSKEALEFSDKHPHMNLRKQDRKRSGYAIDAMPPNGLPYTEGDEWPANPVDGHYHRRTYTAVGTGIPAMLYRWSQKKNQWIYLEKDSRYEHNNTKPLMQEFLDPARSSVTPIDKIDDVI